MERLEAQKEVQKGGIENGMLLTPHLAGHYDPCAASQNTQVGRQRKMNKS